MVYHHTKLHESNCSNSVIHAKTWKHKYRNVDMQMSVGCLVTD